MKPVTTPIPLPKPAAMGAAPARRRRAGRALATAICIAGSIYRAARGALWFGQERLLFAPGLLPAHHHFDLGPDVHEGPIDVPGARLSALHLRLPAPDGVVYFLHGNGGNLQSWFTAAEFCRRANLDLFMIDYRGDGKSTSRIQNQAQFEADVRASWGTIEARYAGKRRVIYGRSLGTALAASLAAEVQPELMVLVSPYQSMRALAAEHDPWVPAALLRYPLRTDEALRRVARPVWIAHGARDTLIGIEHAERLHALVPHSTLVRVPGAGHNDIHQFAAYLEPLRVALQR